MVPRVPHVLWSTVRKHIAANEWEGKRGKCSNRQQALARGPPVQEGLERFQQVNEVEKAQEALPIDPALSAVELRVRAPPRCSNCHIQGHTRVRCPNPLSN